MNRGHSPDDRTTRDRRMKDIPSVVVPPQCSVGINFYISSLMNPSPGLGPRGILLVCLEVRQSFHEQAQKVQGS